MSSQSKPVTAFVLSLIGGVIILLGSAVSFLLFTYGGEPFYNGMMMGGYHWMMGWYGYSSGSMAVFSLVGLIAGILVIIGAIMLNARPREHMTWGIIVLVFSIISCVGMGGFFIGAILGVAGGALALVWRPSNKA